MPARPRKEIVDESKPGFYHCLSRCVRRAYLCGEDSYTGKNYDHRKDWIEGRLAFLASQMSVQVTGHAILDNHLHVVLRNRPDLVSSWSDQEVARRWLTLCPGTRDLGDEPALVRPSRAEIAELVADREQLAECRQRLASLSWSMKFLKEYISRKANDEDQTSGCFWEGRFRSIRLLDPFALLLCSMYVDLNAVRAGKASTPETSRHTSVYLRIRARSGRRRGGGRRGAAGDRLAASWLAPIDESRAPPDGRQSERGRRVSDAGFLPLSLDKYLELLDWSGRQLVRGKRGVIPGELAPILERLEVEVESWLEGLQSFATWYSDFAGLPATLTAHADQLGARWLRGAGRV